MPDIMQVNRNLFEFSEMFEPKTATNNIIDQNLFDTFPLSADSIHVVADIFIHSKSLQ